MTMARCWASRVLLWLAAAILSSGCGSDRAGDSNGQLSRGDSSTTTAGGSKVQLSQDEKALLDRLEAVERTGRSDDLEVEHWIGGGAPPPYSRSDQLRLLAGPGHPSMELNIQTFDPQDPAVRMVQYRAPLGAHELRAVAKLVRETAVFSSRFPEEEKPAVADILRTEVTLSSDKGAKFARRTYHRAAPPALAPLVERMQQITERLKREGTKRCLDLHGKEVPCPR